MRSLIPIRSHRSLSLSLLLLAMLSAKAQDADDFFHGGAQHFLTNNIPGALEVVTNGLQRFPEDEKLKKLYALLNKQQQQQQQQNQDQKQQDQDKKDEQQQQKEQQQKQDQQKEEEKQAKKRDKISKEDAEKILQALNNDEKNTQKKLTKKDATKISINKKW